MEALLQAAAINRSQNTHIKMQKTLTSMEQLKSSNHNSQHGRSQFIQFSSKILARVLTRLQLLVPHPHLFQKLKLPYLNLPKKQDIKFKTNKTSYNQ